MELRRPLRRRRAARVGQPGRGRSARRCRRDGRRPRHRRRVPGRRPPSALARPQPRPLVPGYDFVDDDADPFDENGHGTHVASTIAEQTDNGYGVTGLAYGVRIMPVRVLDRNGDGDAVTIARGVRYAATTARR